MRGGGGANQAGRVHRRLLTRAHVAQNTSHTRRARLETGMRSREHVLRALVLQPCHPATPGEHMLASHDHARMPAPYLAPLTSTAVTSQWAGMAWRGLKGLPPGMRRMARMSVYSSVRVRPAGAGQTTGLHMCMDVRGSAWKCGCACMRLRLFGDNSRAQLKRRLPKQVAGSITQACKRCRQQNHAQSHWLQRGRLPPPHPRAR